MNNLNIKGNRIKGLFRSSTSENWTLLETDGATFELKLGGLNSTTEKRPTEFAIDVPVTDKTIKTVKTDDFSLYLELENGECLIHSNTWVDEDGNTDFEVRLLSKTEFDSEREDWYDSDTDLKEIK